MNIHWKDWCWSWDSNALATWCEELTHWKRPWCWKRLKLGGEGDDRGWDGWMASLTQWTWVWVNLGSWWWTVRLGVLQSMGSQRIGHEWWNELNWTLFPGKVNLTEVHDWSVFMKSVFFFFLKCMSQTSGSRHKRFNPSCSDFLQSKKKKKKHFSDFNFILWFSTEGKREKGENARRWDFLWPLVVMFHILLPLSIEWLHFRSHNYKYFA